MSASVAVLRPEPGNAATAARLEALGLHPLRLPLFRIAPVAWDPPGPGGFDGLLVTSANAIRHAGPALARYRALPVHAVGTATARAAERAGLAVAQTGEGGVADLLAGTTARALLHLAGRDHARTGPPVTATAVVYASEPAPVPARTLHLLDGGVALLHSPRAGARLAALVEEADLPRATVALAAISPAAAQAAGPGWRAVAVAPRPAEDVLIAAARLLAD